MPKTSLKFLNNDVVLLEPLTKVIIKAEENGPLMVEVDGKTTITLCRCGMSKTQPSCDGTHVNVGFTAASSEIKVIE